MYNKWNSNFHECSEDNKQQAMYRANTFKIVDGFINIEQTVVIDTAIKFLIKELHAVAESTNSLEFNKELNDFFDSCKKKITSKKIYVLTAASEKAAIERITIIFDETVLIDGNLDREYHAFKTTSLGFLNTVTITKEAIDRSGKKDKMSSEFIKEKKDVEEYVKAIKQVHDSLKVYLIEVMKYIKQMKQIQTQFKLFNNEISFGKKK